MQAEQCHIVVPYALMKIFALEWTKYRVLYFCAPCGVGKTAVTHELLRERPVCERSAMTPDYLDEPDWDAFDTLLIDDFQAIETPEEEQTICRWINENPDKHFVFLSRGVLPGWLMPYRFTALLTVIDAQAMLLDYAAARELLVSYGVSAEDALLKNILADTKGYPLLIATLCRRMANATPYSEALLEECRRELFHYVEEAVYRRFAPPMRVLLVALAPFEQFDAELARLVSGNSHVNDLLDEILHKTTMLQENGLNTYRYWPIFRAFLLWELDQDCTVEQQNDVYRRAGLYYELHDDYARALDCYTRSGDHCKVSELLVKNAERQVGSAHYYDMERYYRALPREDILRSPALMCGMSVLSALCMEYDDSDQWYAELQSYAAHLKKSDANYKNAKSKLMYLDISLPQRGVHNTAELIHAAHLAITDKSITASDFPVTSTLPSIMNGGKDFCEWSRTDDLLYNTMRVPIEVVLGKDGVGLVDCAICESRFEKGEDVSARLLSLITRIDDIHRKGTPDILFAAIGLIARIQLSQGKSAAALEALENLRQEFTENGQTRFLPNLDAMRCRIWLRLYENDKAERWLREQAPPNAARFRTLWRYRYLTKAMVQLASGAPEDALMTLAPMTAFCERCERTMDKLYVQLLTAICYYRLKTDEWKSALESALVTAWDYSFVTPISQFGAAILPLLTNFKWSGDSDYYARVLAATRVQAVNYPNFLQPAVVLLNPLTTAEMSVLKLLCYNRSNREIADMLGVKLTTVKSQVTSILQKLGVKRRNEAKDAAQTLHLIRE